MNWWRGENFKCRRREPHFLYPSVWLWLTGTTLSGLAQTFRRPFLQFSPPPPLCVLSLDSGLRYIVFCNFIRTWIYLVRSHIPIEFLLIVSLTFIFLVVLTSCLLRFIAAQGKPSRRWRTIGLTKDPTLTTSRCSRWYHITFWSFD